MIHWIASSADPRLEPYRHVGDPEWLRRHDLFVGEGRLVVERLIGAERFTLESVLVNRAAHDALLEPLSRVDSNVFVCDDATLTGITGFNFHRGCLALAVRPAPRQAEALLAGRRVLALESVSNPDNVGGLFRTAAAFGVDGILLNRTAADPFYRKAIRTSMGAALGLPFARVERLEDALEGFRQHGFTIVALTPRAEALPLDRFARELRPERRLMLLLGAEGPGLASTTLNLADARVRIPIESAVDSLNVVVAAGIALHMLSPVPVDAA